MSQIFHRSTNTLSRATIFGAVFVVAALGWVAMEIQRSPYVTYAGVRKPQPVPFSHQHHVTGLGIDCRYCHTSVETSSFAGIPPDQDLHELPLADLDQRAAARAGARQLHSPASRCSGRASTSCPTSSISITAFISTKESAATPATARSTRCRCMYQQESLQMEWCLSCHRAPEKNLRPRDQVFNMRYQQPTGAKPVVVDGQSYTDQADLGTALVKKYNVRSVKDITNCSTCHR